MLEVKSSAERDNHNAQRITLISKKRSLRMQGKPSNHIEIPEKAVCYGYELSDADGTYQGFLADPAEAKILAGAFGYTVKRVEAL